MLVRLRTAGHLPGLPGIRGEGREVFALQQVLQGHPVDPGRLQGRRARQFGHGIATVSYWVERAHGQRLDRVDWADRSRAPYKTRRTTTPLEDLVLKTRTDLAHGDLGAIGADAIRQELLARGAAGVPSVRTINRILARRGALDGRKRTRQPPPPTGWYLPHVAAELDSFDIVEGLVLQGGRQVEILNGVSLHGGQVVSWPVSSPVTAVLTVASLTEHCRSRGRRSPPRTASPRSASQPGSRLPPGRASVPAEAASPGRSPPREPWS
jgi:hypothetical protein